MRACGMVFIFAAGLTLASCNREAHRDEPAARQVGREAYQATQEIKRDAKKAAQEIREAGKEVRQGWNDAKRGNDSGTRERAADK
jgi:uncharacterized membrane protein